MTKYSLKVGHHCRNFSKTVFYLFSVCFFLLSDLSLPAAAQTANAQTPNALTQRSVPDSRTQMTLSFAPLVEQVSDSVVNIYAKRVVESRTPLFRDPFFQRFFGNRLGPARRRVENSLGSGVIVDPSGLIMTNHHVIEGAREIQIGLRDGRTFAARIVLRDSRLDLAILQLEDTPRDLQPAVLGRSDDLLVGDLVLAIGNPFGVGQTVTVGIVSGLARSGVGVSDFQSFIQTDAAINPGNSGGALVSMDGVVIGINTAIFSRSGGSQGIGFAVPGDIARLAVEAAREGREIRRPWLGFSGDKIEQDVREALGLEQVQGVIVANIHPQSAAQRVGLRKGDIILSVGADGLAKGKTLPDGLANGKTLVDMEELRYRALIAGGDETLPLHILRKNKRLTLSLPLEEPPYIPPRNPATITIGPLAGAVVVNLSPAVIVSLNLDSTTFEKTGVVIESFASQSQASRLGFKKGDIILAYNEQKVLTPGQLAGLTEQDSRQKYRLVIERNGRQRRISFR